jgi:hypothetical protein
MMASFDVVCFNRRFFLTKPQWWGDLFLAQGAGGRELCFYNTDKPARRLDPFSYYLVQAWHSFKIGAKGSAFWAFADNSGISSWNEYPLGDSWPYSPLYLDDESVTASKYMEAIREGSEDYEYLVMLRALASELDKRGEGIEQAEVEELLATAVDRVLGGEDGTNYLWDEEKDRSLADQARKEILEVLARNHDILSEGQ